MFGFSQGEFDKRIENGEKVDFVPIGHKPTQEEVLLIKDGDKKIIPVMKTKRKDGSFFYLRMDVAFSVHEGEPVIAYAVLMDVTSVVEMKESEDSFREMYKLLIESNDLVYFDYLLSSDTLHVSYISGEGKRTDKNIAKYSSFFLGPSIHVNPTYKDGLMKDLGKLRQSPSSLFADFQCVGPDGLNHFYHAKMVSVASGGEVRRFLGRLEIFDNLMEEQEKKLFAAHVDGVSGLLDKDAAKDEITHRLLSGHNSGSDYLLFFDIDDFKKINDTIGHLKADKILSRIGAILSDNFRSTDILSRFGGDEFLVYMGGPSTKESVISKIETIMKAINSLTTPEGPVGCSLGAVLVDDGLKSFEQVFNMADEAMYASKKLGKNRFSFFEQPNKHD